MGALLWFAWQGQVALQYATPRSTGGQQMAIAALLLSGLLIASRRLLRNATVADSPVNADEGELASRTEWLLVGGLVLLGAFFRTVHFESVPDGINHDAAFNGMYAHAVWAGIQKYTPYVTAAWGRETLFMYLVAGFMPLLGTSPEVIQAASALCGILALVPMYLFARALAGRRVALITLALFAVSGWHGVYSRAGWRVISVPPFELLALYALLRAAQTRKFRYWVLLGAACGGVINTYNAGRVVPLICAALAVVLFLRDPANWKRWLSGATVSLATFLVVGGPMLWFAVNHWQQWQARAEHLVDEREALSRPVANTRDALGMFNYRGNGNDYFIEEPLLEPLAGVLLILGTATVLTRIRKPESAVLLVGLLLALLPGIMTSPNGNRCVTAMPFVYVMIALGTVELTDQFAGLFPSPRRTALSAALAALLLCISAGETWSEFLGSNRRPVLGFNASATAAADYIRAYMSTHKVYTVAGDWPEYTFSFLTWDGHGYPFEPQLTMRRSFQELDDEIDRVGKKPLLIVTGMDEAGRQALEKLERRFAEHRIEPIKAKRRNNEVLAQAFFVEAQSLSRSGLWSNTSRTLLAQGSPSSSGTLCFETLSSGEGVSGRVEIMLPEITDTAEAGLEWLASCDGPPVAALTIDAKGLQVSGKSAVPLVAQAELRGGQWYTVEIALARSSSMKISLDGKEVGSNDVSASSIGAVRLRAANTRAFVDEVVVLAGYAAPEDPRWKPAERGQTRSFTENFESKPFGPVVGWKGVQGSLSVANAPTEWRSGQENVAGGNAFDGGQGEQPGEFAEPTGIAALADGTFFVSDRLNHRVQKFTAQGDLITTWGKLGDKPGEFREPADLAADEHNLYVADTWNQRIQVFDHDGNFLYAITEPSLSSPRGIFARGGHIYVADTGNGVIRVFDLSGKLEMSLGEKGGSEPGHFIEPVDVVADSKGNVFATNPGNDRIEVFNAAGTFVRSIPIAGWTGNGLKEFYLAIDDHDGLYLSDWEVRRIRRFKPDGTELEPIGPQMNRPSGLAWWHDQVLVAARGENRIRSIPSK